VTTPPLGMACAPLRTRFQSACRTRSASTLAGLGVDQLVLAVRQQALAARVEVFGPPPVDGLGTVAGFKLVVEDRGDYGPVPLEQAADAVVRSCSEDRRLSGLFTNFSASTPWLFLDIDRDKAAALGVSMQDLIDTLQIQLGSFYVNNFNRFGRSWQVNMQADGHGRTTCCHACLGDTMPMLPCGFQPRTRWSPVMKSCAPAPNAAATKRASASWAGSARSGTHKAQAHSESNRSQAATWRLNLRCITPRTSSRTKALVSRRCPRASSSSTSSAHRPGNTTAASQTFESRNTFMAAPGPVN
jgi:hypothetical protein